MDPQELARAQVWFQERVLDPQLRCPICHSHDWRMQPVLGQIEHLTETPPISTGRLPVFVVTCRTCGYFLTINALDAGVRRPED